MPRLLSFLRRKRAAAVDAENETKKDTECLSEALAATGGQGTPLGSSRNQSSAERDRLSPDETTHSSTQSYQAEDIAIVATNSLDAHEDSRPDPPSNTSDSGSYYSNEGGDHDDDYYSGSDWSSSSSSPGDSGWSSADNVETWSSDDDLLEEDLEALFEEQTMEAMLISEEDSSFENLGAPPASPAVIEGLPCICVTEQDLIDPANQSCIVCLEPNNLGDTNVTRLPCTHMFHAECLRSWLERHCTCPVCRYEVPTEDKDFEIGRTERMSQRKPRYSKQQLERLSVKELRALLPVSSPFESYNRYVLTNNLIRTKAIELVVREEKSEPDQGEPFSGKKEWSEINSVETQRTSNRLDAKSRRRRRKRTKRSAATVSANSKEDAELAAPGSNRSEQLGSPNDRSEVQAAYIDTEHGSTDNKFYAAEIYNSVSLKQKEGGICGREHAEAGSDKVASPSSAVSDSVEASLSNLIDQFLKETQQIDISSVGDSMLTLASAYTDVGCSYVSGRNWEAALEHYEKALLLYTTIRGMHHPETADALDFIGSVYCEERDYECALLFHSDALEVRKRIYGREHPHTALSHLFVGSALFNLVEYDCALIHQRESLRINKAAFGDRHASVATSHAAIGLTLHSIGKLDDALEHLTKAFTIRTLVLGEYHEDTATSLSMIGAVQYDRKRMPEATENFQRALDVRRLVVDELTPCTAVAHANLAAVLSLNGTTRDAIRHYKEALRIFKHCYGLYHVDTAAVCHNLGRLQAKLESFDEALELLEEALSVREILHTRGEIKYCDVILSCAEIGLVLCDTGRPQDAFARLESTKKKFEQKNDVSTPERDQKRSDICFESLFSADIMSTMLLNKRLEGNHRMSRPESSASSESSMSAIQTTPEQVNEPISTFNAESDSNERYMDKDFPCDTFGCPSFGAMGFVAGCTGTPPIRGALSLLAEGYSDIGRFCVGNGEMDSALDLFTKALSMYKTARGACHPETSGALDCVAAIHSSLGSFEQAFRIHSAALEIRKNVHGEAHPHTATSHYFIGSVQFDMEEYEESLSSHKKALDIREKSYGLGHEATAISYEAVACLLFKLGDHDSSLEHHLVALKIRETVLGSDHPRTARSYSCIGSVQRDRGLFSESISNHERALTIRQNTLGDYDPDTASSSSNITNVQIACEEKGKELIVCKDALKTFKRVYGKHHELTATAQNDLGILHHQLGNYEMALKLLKKSMKTRERLHREFGNMADQVSATRANIESAVRDQKRLSRCVTVASSC